MKTTKISHIAHLVEICVQHGISKVVISPGSRNAPLIIAFDSHPKIETFIVHDERSAAFFAMGLAEESGNPVAITCTSGSAPINYAPAVSEAYYRSIPILILTADRPVELVDQGDGQTIRQNNLYQNFIKASFQLPNLPSRAERVLSDKTVNQALIALHELPKGPVHINIPLAEPLYENQNLISTPLVQKVAFVKNQLSTIAKQEIKEGWVNSNKKLLLIGQFKPNALNLTLLKNVLNDPSVAVLVESTANLHDFYRVCHCIDRTLAILKPEDIIGLKPDLLISFGGAIISKKIKTFFRQNKPKANWRIGTFFFEEDTYQSLSKSYQINPNIFLEFVANIQYTPNSNYGSQWKQKDFLAETKHKLFLENTPFSDLKVFDLILDTIPSDAKLHMSNSSTVRYCQLFNPIPGIHYYSNRGVSGIDGSTSTAVGIAVEAKDKLNVLITGDTSFFYDSNALWNNYLPSNLRIIVINNGGGGIFKIIDGPNKIEQSNYFVAPFEAKIKSVAETYSLNYFYANSVQSLETVFEAFYRIANNNRPAILEVDTQNIANGQILKDYFASIALDS